VKSATDRKLIVKPTGGKTAAAFDAFVAKHSAEYDEDDLSGDEDDDAVYDDEDEDVRDGETTTEGDPSLNGDGEDAERKKHVHEPEWTGAVGKSAAERRDDANKARDLARDDADDAAAVDEIVSGFAPGGLRDELVTEASNVRGVGQADDYAGAGNDDDDGDLDAFAQAPEPAAKKRTAGARSKAPAEKISNAEKEKDKKRGAEKTATGAPPKRARGKK
jgi:hypothetical protein